jgi:hypothetical protein
MCAEMKSWIYKNGPTSIGINAFAMQVSFLLQFTKLTFSALVERKYAFPKSKSRSQVCWTSLVTLKAV